MARTAVKIPIRHDLIDPIKSPELPETGEAVWDALLYLPVLQWSRVACDSFEEWPNRPRCGHFFGGSYWYGLETAMTVYALAVIARTGPFDDETAGASREEIIEQAIAGIRYLGFTHDTGPEDCVRVAGPNPHASLRKWGGAGDNFFQASQHGTPVSHLVTAAWLLWDHLNDETRQLMVNVLESYADRWSVEMPHIGTYLDTQTEETVGPVSASASPPPCSPPSARRAVVRGGGTLDGEHLHHAL